MQAAVRPRLRTLELLGRSRRHRIRQWNPPAAAQAKQKAIACYLAFRRDGGENHGEGRLVVAMTEQLRTAGLAAACSFLDQVAADADNAPLRPFIQALQTVLQDSRDRNLANSPDLDYGMAAEILLLIDKLST